MNYPQGMRYFSEDSRTTVRAAYGGNLVEARHSVKVLVELTLLGFVYYFDSERTRRR